MFNRIRYAAKVLSHSPPKVRPYDTPDIVFEEEPRLEINKASNVIGSVIEIVMVSIVVGIVSGPIIFLVFPAKEKAGLATITGIMAGFLAIVANRLLEALNAHIRLKLKIGEKIAPYFGHKITRTLHILRG